MPKQGWEKLLTDLPKYGAKARFPIAAYSEFMPPPRIGWRPYDTNHPAQTPRGTSRRTEAALSPAPRDPQNPLAWLVSEREQTSELQPGMEIIARQVLSALQRLDRNQSAEGISRAILQGNAYWPEELAALPGALAHERYVMFLPLALSRTQDDKGRVRWTFFGGSEQGPDRAFWKSFYNAPGRESPPEYAVDFIRRLLHDVYSEPPARLTDLHNIGFRILPGSGESINRHWRQDPLPSWTKPYIMSGSEALEGVKYILTFRPFGSLPQSVRQAYLSGRLHLLPFPGSLIFWGVPSFLSLQRELLLAMQIPLLNVCERHEATRGLRTPQSGWMHEPRAGMPPAPVEPGNTYRRTHRWERVERQKDDLASAGHEDRVARVLFSCDPVDIDLYSKPMARNAQIWTDRHELLLDGPRAGQKELRRAAEVVAAGGRFGYRFHFPPMVVGKYEVLWHLPLVAYLDPNTNKPQLPKDAPLGYVTAYDTHMPSLTSPVELWPELRRRPEMVATVPGYREVYEHRDYQIALNAHKLIEIWDFLGQQVLPWDFARSIVNIPKDQTLDRWLEEVASWNAPGGYGVLLHHTLRRIILPRSDASQRPLPEPLTYEYTANRRFEETYWKTIAQLATGRFLNKDNADCVNDPPSKAIRRHRRRDLEALGDWLLAYYRRVITRHGMRGKALAGELPFHWRTDFDFPWMEGWLANQSGKPRERNLLVVVPGMNHKRAVIMADHYDTAYMEDLYYEERGGKLARIAAAGADDNHSATAALMLAAPVFMEMSRAGKLACDVWLVHLTGEEFPSDCMGARHLAQGLVEGSLKLRVPGRKSLDLSKVEIEGVYVLDMIAHNRFPDRDVFQISPGLSRKSCWLAFQAHLATMIWNGRTEEWNHAPERRDRGRGQRSSDGTTIPEIARHPELHGEVRVPRDPRSSLFNTDGQIFSDVGVPVVLFMENYDINRTGYHDTQDNMSNIDLDYGSAVAAIAIESVARVAHAPLR